MSQRSNVCFLMSKTKVAPSLSEVGEEVIIWKIWFSWNGKVTKPRQQPTGLQGWKLLRCHFLVFSSPHTTPTTLLVVQCGKPPCECFAHGVLDNRYPSGRLETVRGMQGNSRFQIPAREDYKWSWSGHIFICMLLGKSSFKNEVFPTERQAKTGRALCIWLKWKKSKSVQAITNSIIIRRRR